MSNEKILHLSENTRGRDYIVGDIHGLFSVLEEKLAFLSFDPSVDRLISVGDLIDRGPESPRVTEFLAQPWFYACRGNHEQMALQAIDSDRDSMIDWYRNGGQWFWDCDEAVRDRIEAALRPLPWAIDIRMSNGDLIGIIHADVPYGLTWQAVCDHLGQVNLRTPTRDAVCFGSVWSRDRIMLYCYGPSDQPGFATSGIAMRDPRVPVEGVSRLYVGHTPFNQPLRLANVQHLDTGASFQHEGSHFTFAELRPASGCLLHRIKVKPGAAARVDPDYYIVEDDAEVEARMARDQQIYGNRGQSHAL